MIRLRCAATADAKAISEIYRPYVETTAITFEYEAPDETEFVRRITHTLAQYPYIVCELDGRVVGYAYASPFHARAAYAWCCETSIYVERGLRKQGIGRLLLTALEDALTAMGITCAVAVIAACGATDPYLDDASILFHSRMGYTEAGRLQKCGHKFDRAYDIVWMEKRLAEEQSPMPAVIPFPECGYQLP